MKVQATTLANGTYRFKAYGYGTQLIVHTRFMTSCFNNRHLFVEAFEKWKANNGIDGDKITQLTLDKKLMFKSPKD